MSDAGSSNTDSEDAAYQYHVAVMSKRLQEEAAQVQAVHSSADVPSAGTGASSPQALKREMLLRAALEEEDSDGSVAEMEHVSKVLHGQATSPFRPDLSTKSQPAPSLSVASITEMIKAHQSGSTGLTDRRGSYDRKKEDVQVKGTHEFPAWTHLQQVTRRGIGDSCKLSCPYGRNCHIHFSPAALLAAHRRVYGSYTTCLPDSGEYKM
eukprot:1017914-Pleurochrysis_carterae.AAC.1